MKYFRILLPIFLLFILFAKTTQAQQAKPIHYIKTEMMVPMRDGVQLFTRIYTPDNISTSVPILIMRSPYGDWNMGLLSPEKDPYVANMAAGGYIFVYQNLRGKEKSEGDFEMEAAFEKNNYNAIDEASDTYDLIEWLLKNVKSNGKVGQLGISYPGEVTLLSAIKPHPALKAVSPQGTVADFFLGDDYFHNGAFRLAFSFEYSYSEETAKGETPFPFSQYDLYEWYLNLGPLSNVNKKYFHNEVPTWDSFIAHPNYDSYWSDKAPVNYSDTPHIPILHVGGYWDQENVYGPQALYGKMEKFDTKNFNYLILGPWYHGHWADSDASKLADFKMGRNTAAEFRVFQKQWFDYWLKGIGDGKFPEAICYQTGSNLWKTYDAWPPVKETTTQKLYLNDGKKLSFHKPVNDKGFDNYISDPENPVTYRERPIEATYSDSSSWEDWLMQDQRLSDHRPDVLSYESDPLDSGLTITGDIVTHLFASTTGSDADWVVKLIDVYPDHYKARFDLSQYELMIASDIFRARFRKSYTVPQAVTPGKVEEYTINLHQINHVFQKGHKIMIQMQSTWFPLFDRNPQKYMPNIFLATEKDYIKATQSIYRSKKYATYIELPVVK